MSGAAGGGAAMRAALDVALLRRDFPILDQQVHGKPLVYLDNAASTQKPRAVLDAIQRFYLTECSNVHRGLHRLSTLATADFEDSRQRVRRFLNAADLGEIVFTHGTTEAINLVAHSYGDLRIGAGDEILLTEMEHHSNIVPWQLLCERRGARLVVAPCDDAGELILEEFERRLGPRTRLVAVVHSSNAIGTRNPVERIVELAHGAGAVVLIDAAQAVAHERIDVQALDCDFLTFSAHKMYGPTGVGVLYGKAAHLEAMPPFLGGGDMIRTVSFERSTWNDLPHKFEAGTPHIAGAIGLGAAVDYLEGVGVERIAAAESALLAHALELLADVPGLRLIGAARRRAPLVSFVLDGIHPHDVGTVLDHEGVAVRAGHHCAQPLMQRFGLPATVRASFGCYNTLGEVETLRRGLDRVRQVLG